MASANETLESAEKFDLQSCQESICITTQRGYCETIWLEFSHFIKKLGLSIVANQSLTDASLNTM